MAALHEFIQVSFPGNDELADRRFEVKRLTGEERISGLFKYTLIFEERGERGPTTGEVTSDGYSEPEPLDFDDMMAQSITVSIQREGETKRYINGVIGKIVSEHTSGYAEEDEPRLRYNVEIHPALWLLTLTTDCQTFVHRTAMGVITSLLDEFEIAYNKDKLNLLGTYHQRKHIEQFNESPFHLITRLLDQEGIFYFFEHEEDRHTLVLADDNGDFPFCDIPDSGSHTATMRTVDQDAEDTVIACAVEQNVVPGRFEMGDVFFEGKDAISQKIRKAQRIPGLYQSGKGNPILSKLKVSEYPGGGTSYGDINPLESGDNVMKKRLEQMQASKNVARGSSYCRAFAAGCKFELAGHSHSPANRMYVLRRIFLDAYGEMDEQGREQGMYINEFEAFPADVPFRGYRYVDLKSEPQYIQMKQVSRSTNGRSTGPSHAYSQQAPPSISTVLHNDPTANASTSSSQALIQYAIVADPPNYTGDGKLDVIPEWQSDRQQTYTTLIANYADYFDADKDLRERTTDPISDPSAEDIAGVVGDEDKATAEAYLSARGDYSPSQWQGVAGLGAVTARLALHWAGGNQWGFQFLPRSGTRVVIMYPYYDDNYTSDTEPVIVGTLYDGSNSMPSFDGTTADPKFAGMKTRPYGVEGTDWEEPSGDFDFAKLVGGWTTRLAKKGIGSSGPKKARKQELYFDDTPGSQEIYFDAAKTFTKFVRDKEWSFNAGSRSAVIFGSWGTQYLMDLYKNCRDDDGPFMGTPSPIPAITGSAAGFSSSFLMQTRDDIYVDGHRAVMGNGNDDRVFFLNGNQTYHGSGLDLAVTGYSSLSLEFFSRIINAFIGNLMKGGGRGGSKTKAGAAQGSGWVKGLGGGAISVRFGVEVWIYEMITGLVPPVAMLLDIMAIKIAQLGKAIGGGGKGAVAKALASGMFPVPEINLDSNSDININAAGDITIKAKGKLTLVGDDIEIKTYAKDFVDDTPSPADLSEWAKIVAKPPNPLGGITIDSGLGNIDCSGMKISQSALNGISTETLLGNISTEAKGSNVTVKGINTDNTGVMKAGMKANMELYLLSKLKIKKKSNISDEDTVKALLKTKMNNVKAAVDNSIESNINITNKSMKTASDLKLGWAVKSNVFAKMESTLNDTKSNGMTTISGAINKVG